MNSRGVCYIIPTLVTPIPPPVVPPETVVAQCGHTPGAGPDTELITLGAKKIKLVRGSHAIQYGNRQRSLFKISDLPAAVGKHVVAGKELSRRRLCRRAAATQHLQGIDPARRRARIVYVPMVNGGTAPACVQYCPQQVAIAKDPAVPTVIATTVVEPKKPAVPTVIASALCRAEETRGADSHRDTFRRAEEARSADRDRSPYVEPAVKRPAARPR